MTRNATANERFDHDRDLRKHDFRNGDRVRISDLCLADVVELFEGPFGTGTVRRITKDGEVIISRPYGVTQDFSYTGGVPFSVGVEEVSYFFSSSRMLKVFQRKELR
jgi:hypothetical protein